MGKLATRPKAAPKAAIRSNKGRKPDTVTFNSGAGYSREPKSELFLLAVTNMVSENTFYEKAETRDRRFNDLIRQVALEDPDWVARFVPYLRDTMNMRSASIVMAAELVHAKLTRPVSSGTIRNRAIIDSAIRRADEPAEMLGYWMSEWGRKLPQPVKRGVADAAIRVYNERSLIKYDGGDKPIRFGNVIDLVHPEAKAPWQSSLFRYALDTRHKREILLPWAEGAAPLPMIQNNRAAMAMADGDFRAMFSPLFVENAGLTWEQASSKYGKLDAKFWEAMIPNMGIFALVRNLRNFDDAKISPAARELVKTELMDAETIRRSRMFPLRFFQAMVANATLHYHEALEEAIKVSVENVPSLKGNSLILVDISSSMDYPLSAKGDTKRLAPASIFGAALAVRAERADLVAFTTTSTKVPFRKDGSVLLVTKAIVDALPHGGTQTWQAVQQHFGGHDRVIIITDEQADAFAGWRDWGDKDPSSVIPETTPLFTFNLAGYSPGHAPSGKRNRYAFGGLTDAAFTAIELLERGNDESWPF
jgi:hypothetical protein